MELSQTSTLSKGKEKAVADLLEASVSSLGEYEEELIREQLARCYAVFKEEGMERIRKAKVVVVGCGGVGSWAAVMLVRRCVICH